MPRPKILFLAHLLPWPLEGGGQIKSYHTLRLLSERYNVKMIALIRRPEEEEYTEHLKQFCTGGIVCHLLKRNALSNLFHAVWSLLRNQSFIVSRDNVPVASWYYRNKPWYIEYDAIHVDHLQMAQYLPDVLYSHSDTQTKIVLDQHNVEHRIVRRLAETPGGKPLLRGYAGIEWRKLRDFETATIRRAGVTLAVSDEDRAAFLSLAPNLVDNIKTVPIGVDTDYFSVVEREPGANDLLSIGTMSWLPNVDAMQWFVSDILPLVREKRPSIRLQIVGAKPTEAVRALARHDSKITVTGTVPDVRPYAAQCGVFIVPLRSGSGVRVKILNALSMGLPVVSTTLGAEGIRITPGDNILIGDTPRAFADAVLSVLDNPELARRLGANGRALMEAEYGWEAVGQRLHTIYEEVLRTR